MPILVPTGVVYKATAGGASLREVVCHNCAGRFYYVLRRVGKGRGSAPLWIGREDASHEAGSQAEARLAYALKHDTDPVACLYCGRYQPEMLDAARNRRFPVRWGCLGAAGAALAPVVVALAFFDQKGQESAGYFAYALGPLFLVAYFVARARFDPNRNATSRLGAGAAGQPPRYAELAQAEKALAGEG